MEDNEKVITTKDVLEYTEGAVLVLSIIVGIFALIWANWLVFRICATIGWVIALIELAKGFFKGILP